MEHVVRLIAVRYSKHRHLLFMELLERRIDSVRITFVSWVILEFLTSYDPWPIVYQIELLLEIASNAEFCPQLNLRLGPEIKDSVSLEIVVKHPWGPSLLHIIVLEVKWQDYNVVQIPFFLHCVSLLKCLPVHCPRHEPVNCRVVYVFNVN